MPAQTQSPVPATELSEDTINSFMDLDTETQGLALKGMSPASKEALLTGIKARSVVRHNPDAPKIQADAGVQGVQAGPGAELPAPPPVSATKLVNPYARPVTAENVSDLATTAAAMGRGAALGAAEGAGIPESKTSMGVVTGALGNAASGYYQAGKALGTDIVNAPGTPLGMLINGSRVPESQTYKILASMAHGMDSSALESWKALKDQDPEAFAHGLGSLVTQMLMLKGGKEAVATVGETSARARLAKASASIKVGADEAAALADTMPDIAKAAQQGGVATVGEFADAVNRAKDGTDATFNRGFLPIANKPYVPMEISRRILNLITPDMRKTPDGRAKIKQITQAALPYQNKWTLNEINSKRMTENKALARASFYEKDTRGQADAQLAQDISKATRDGAADIVYDQWAQANRQGPLAGIDPTNLKQRQGKLWSLSDYLGDANKGTGYLGDLRAKQLVHEGSSVKERIRANVSASGGGLHAYLSGLSGAFSKGPEAVAGAKMAEAFRGPTMTQRAGKLGVAMLPISALMGQDLGRDKARVRAGRRASLPEPPSANGPF